MFRDGLAALAAILGPEHPTVATAVCNLSHLNRQLGHIDDAKAMAQRSLDMRERLLPPGHPDTAQSLSALGLAYVAEHDEAGSIPLFARAVLIQEDRLGGDHQQTQISLTNLGDALFIAGHEHLGVIVQYRALQSSLNATDPRMANDRRPFASYATLLTLKKDLRPEEARDLMRVNRLYEGWMRSTNRGGPAEAVLTHFDRMTSSALALAPPREELARNSLLAAAAFAELTDLDSTSPMRLRMEERAKSLGIVDRIANVRETAIAAAKLLPAEVRHANPVGPELWVALDEIVPPPDWDTEFPDITDWDASAIGSELGATDERIRSVLEALAAGEFPDGG